jgi:DNA mismatch repair protein MutS2
LSGLHTLRVIHGFGTGAMHQAVHEYLECCPLVKSYRRGNPEKDEGGAGVTWVEMN